MDFKMNVAVILSVALAAVQAAPQYAQPQQYSSQQYSPPIPIVSQTNDGPYPDGSYSYSYVSGNGIQVEEKGYNKNPNSENGLQSAAGYFQYPSPDGATLQVTYTADENGFVPQGAHLPTPPPPPPELVKAYQEAPQDNGEYDENGNLVKPQRYSRSEGQESNSPLQPPFQSQYQQPQPAQRRYRSVVRNRY